MMFVDDLRGDFYSEIKGERVLIVVNYDIDAICACKILQTLFKTDYTPYTLVTVDVTTDLKLSFRENRLNEKYIIFINCGGTIDLVEELLPEDDITFFVLDSHRPIDVCNVYNPTQVKLLSKADEGIPEFQDIFSDDDDDDDEDKNEENKDDLEDVEDDGSEEFESQQAKRRRLIQEANAKRAEKILWGRKRDALLFNYMKYNSYGRSSALTLYELAWKMSKDNFDLLWYAIVGLTEQMMMRKISEEKYIAECGDVQNHVLRLSHRSSQLGDEGRNTAVRIEFDKDLRLALLRHWTVKSSLTYSMFTATRLKLWTFRGEKRLHEMLAEIGIPLIQCNQKFASMDLVFRKEFHESLEKMSSKYGLDGIALVSFLIQHGFQAKYTATDFVYSLLALLQSHKKERSMDCFLECLDALSRAKKEKLENGIELAKKILVSIFRQVQNALEMKQIQCAGPFLYLVVQEGNADPVLCNHPYGILLLAEFALRAYAASTKVGRYKVLPLVVSTPCIKDKANAATPVEEEALCHVTGVAPLAQENNSNLFGSAFKKAAENSLSPIQDCYFDSAVIKLKLKDRTRFLDALAVLFTAD